ncbi:hypothetical protein C8Q73DRAFT_711749 [Cubamyces lactineus]|nr:hypothetical protein C8Q73DRAFT_711749 [Cubamyces lactineus]
MLVDHKGSPSSARADSTTSKTKRGTRAKNSKKSETSVAISRPPTMPPTKQAQGAVSNRAAWSPEAPVTLQTAGRYQSAAIMQFPLEAISMVGKVDNNGSDDWLVVLRGNWMRPNLRSFIGIPRTGHIGPRIDVNRRVRQASPQRLHDAQHGADNGLGVLGAVIVIVTILIGVWMWVGASTSGTLPILWNLLRDSWFAVVALVRMMRSLIGVVVTAVNTILPIALWVMVNCTRLLVGLWTASLSSIQRVYDIE